MIFIRFLWYFCQSQQNTLLKNENFRSVSIKNMKWSGTKDDAKYIRWATRPYKSSYQISSYLIIWGIFELIYVQHLHFSLIFSSYANADKNVSTKILGEASTIIFWLLPFTAALLTKRDILENGFFFPHCLIVFSLISREKLNWKFHFPQTKSKSFEVFSDLCHYQQRSRIKDCGKCIFGFTGSYRSIIPYIKSIDTIKRVTIY